MRNRINRKLTIQQNLYDQETALIKQLEANQNKCKQKCQGVCNLIPACMIISYKNKARRLWEVLPAILSIYNTLTIPIELTFRFKMVGD